MFEEQFPPGKLISMAIGQAGVEADVFLGVGEGPVADPELRLVGDGLNAALHHLIGNVLSVIIFF